MLALLPYHHLATKHFLQQTDVWNFFLNHKQKEEELKDFKTSLLKNTYKFDPDVDVSIFEKVTLAKNKLGLVNNVHVYQQENITDANASTIFLDNEVHIVFTGNLIQSLSDEELTAVIAHELSHTQLYSQLDGQVEVTNRIIRAIGNNDASTAAHYETARLFNLYTEIFCDRGAYTVTGDYAPIITSLVKLATGLQKVNADSYIKQAEEIFTTDINTRASGISHPENFIRARAIWLWHSKGATADAMIQEMIEGKTGLDELDIFKQADITALTKQMVGLIATPTWMRSGLVMSLANQYFPTLNVNDPADLTSLTKSIANLHPSVHEYLAYVLYDFTTCDKQLEDVPMGYAIFLADALQLQAAFDGVLKKELKLTDKKISTLKKKVLAEYQRQESSTVN